MALKQGYRPAFPHWMQRPAAFALGRSASSRRFEAAERLSAATIVISDERRLGIQPIATLVDDFARVYGTPSLQMGGLVIIDDLDPRSLATEGADPTAAISELRMVASTANVSIVVSFESVIRDPARAIRPDLAYDIRNNTRLPAPMRKSDFDVSISLYREVVFNRHTDDPAAIELAVFITALELHRFITCDFDGKRRQIRSRDPLAEP